MIRGANFFLCLLVCLSPLSVSALELVTRTQLLMGDVPVAITVKTQSSKKDRALAAMEKAFNEAGRIENEVSEFKPKSRTSALNHSEGNWINVGLDLMQILLLARKASEATAGAFDITFASRNYLADYKDVLLDPAQNRAKLARKKMNIGLGGIAKGYIVDRMSAVLKKEGFAKHLVNAGDIYAAGLWEVGLRNPDRPRGAPLCALKLKNRAVSTSGNDERPGHITDPKSRRPLISPSSVTVVSKTSVWADAMATAAYILYGRQADSFSLPDILFVSPHAIPNIPCRLTRSFSPLPARQRHEKSP